MKKTFVNCGSVGGMEYNYRTKCMKRIKGRSILLKGISHNQRLHNSATPPDEKFASRYNLPLSPKLHKIHRKKILYLGILLYRYCQERVWLVGPRFSWMKETTSESHSLLEMQTWDLGRGAALSSFVGVLCTNGWCWAEVGYSSGLVGVQLVAVS